MADEIQLNDEEEAALDRAWARLHRTPPHHAGKQELSCPDPDRERFRKELREDLDKLFDE